jgi:hypothetical protein
MRKSLCRCDGRYEGCTHGRRCIEVAGGHRSPYFCPECDKRRIVTINRKLIELLAELGAPDE